MTLRDALWLLVLCAGVYAAWQARGCREPDTVTVTRTDTTFVDREIVRRDTVTETRPVERVIYERTTDTVYVRLPVPSGFTARGLIGAHPVDITGRTVTLTRWDPHALRWTQDVYRVRRKNWSVWPAIGGDRTPWGVQAGARVGVRYRRVSGYVGYAFGPDRSALTFGLYLRPFTIRF